jgi:hypothetical protein
MARGCGQGLVGKSFTQLYSCVFIGKHIPYPMGKFFN